MNLKVWFGPTIWAAAETMLSRIEHQDMQHEHIVVVPDRFSLLAEKMLLDNCSCGALFNVSVMGVSGLAKYLLEKDGTSITVLSNSEALLWTQQAILEVENEFQYFKKSNIRFCNEIYKVISQFKSCDIHPEDLSLTNVPATLTAKYHDLQLIYSTYERLVAGRVDANSLLTALLEAETAQDYQNLHFYFAGFDSFTEKVYLVIQKLAALSVGVQISLAKPKSIANAFIYETDIMEKLIGMSKMNGLQIEAQEPAARLNAPQLSVITNLFAKPLTIGLHKTYYESFTADDVFAEVGFIAKRIRYEIVKGAKFGEIQVACSDLRQYAGVIEKVFNELEIPYYLDLTVTAQETVLARLIDALLEVVISGYSYESLLSLFASPFVQTEHQDVLRKLQQYEIFGKNRYKRFLAKDSGILDAVLLQYEAAKCYREFCLVTLSLLEVFGTQIIQLDTRMQEKQYFKEQALQQQITEVLIDICQTLSSMRGEEACSINEFRKTLQLLLSFREISTVPAYADAVLIGDATASFFDTTEYLFILGGQALPQQVGDTGIISDDDIENLKIGKKIEPSIRMINRRNRFKVFNLCSLAKSHLIVSYLSVNQEGKKIERPSYIEDLNSIFQTESLPVYAFYNLNGINETVDLEKFLLSIGNKQLALSEHIPFIASRNSDRYLTSLQSILKTDYDSFQLQRNQIQADNFNLYFPKNYTKVTELETYFDCPFKHFVRYGLRLKELEKSQFDARDIGNICHALAEKFVSANQKTLGSIVEVEIERFLDLHLFETIEKLGLNEKLETAVDQTVTLSYVRRQTKFMLSRICEEQKYSQFKPLFVEKIIQNVSIKIKDGVLLPVQGKVDRIDVCDNYFRILDYKTGAVHPILKDLYYGDKLQLFLYEGFAAAQLGLTAAGAFYFDCRWDYNKPDEDDMILKGLVRNDDTLIPLFDHRLLSGPSGLVAISPKVGGGYKGAAISKVELCVYENYAKKMATNALQEIIGGYIEPKPDADSCNGCAYQGICLFDKRCGFRKKGKVGDANFTQGENNG